jgi:hypothetical protein
MKGHEIPEMPRCNVRLVHARWRPGQASACLWMREEKINGEKKEGIGEEEGGEGKTKEFGEEGGKEADQTACTEKEDDEEDSPQKICRKGQGCSEEENRGAPLVRGKGGSSIARTSPLVS